MHAARGETLTSDTSSADLYLREVHILKEFFLLGIGIEGYLDHLSLAIGVSGEVHHLRSFGALRQVVNLVACDAGNIETLDKAEAFLAVTIHHIIYSTRVVLLEHGHMDDVLTHKDLVGHTDNLVLSVTVEEDDIIDI